MCAGNRVTNCPNLPVTEKFPSHGSFQCPKWGNLKQAMLKGTYHVLGISYMSPHLTLTDHKCRFLENCSPRGLNLGPAFFVKVAHDLQFP